MSELIFTIVLFEVAWLLFGDNKKNKQSSRSRTEPFMRTAGSASRKTSVIADISKFILQKAVNQNDFRLPTAVKKKAYFKRPTKANAFKQPVTPLSSAKPTQEAASQSVQKPDITFDKNEVIKAFIMSEVLQRYDINRIYSRIPNFKADERQ